jgi:hypothetical protein
MLCVNHFFSTRKFSVKDYTPNELSERIKLKQGELKSSLEAPSALSELVTFTLNNFAYRYFETPTPAQALSNEHFCVQAIEVGIKEAIKIQNPKLRDGLKSLMLRVSKEQGPTVARILDVQVSGQGPLVLTARAAISWGHPDHQLCPDTFVSRELTVELGDLLELRNSLALHLETVCELFS